MSGHKKNPPVYFCNARGKEVRIKGPNDWPENLTLDGKTYSFTHLQPQTLKLTKPAKDGLSALEIDLILVFDCHVVTEEIKVPITNLPNAEAYWCDSGGRLREFSPLRYEKSLSIFQLIDEAANKVRKCYETHRNNALIWERRVVGQGVEAAPFSGDYQIFFTATKADSQNRVRLYIQSAYVRTNSLIHTNKYRETRLVNICLKVLGLAKGKSQKR